MVTKYILDGDFSEIPELSGIYSWFYPMRIYEEDTYESFMHRVRYFLNYSLFTSESELWLKMTQGNAWETYNVLFELKGKDSGRVRRKWDSIKNDPEFKRCVFESSIWNRPLYVGKADNLLQRVSQHQNGVTGFSQRFEGACSNYSFNDDPDFRFATSLSVRNLLLSYTLFDLKKTEVEALEKIMQFTTKPNFSIK